MNTYQYDLLTRLDFTRYGGTDAEFKAANIILEEIEKAGGKGEIMDFKIPAYDLKKCSLKVTAPFEMELETVPYGLSGCLPEGGVDLKLVYLQKGTENDFYGVGDLSDSIVMLNELSFDAYKRMYEKMPQHLSLSTANGTTTAKTATFSSATLVKNAGKR